MSTQLLGEVEQPELIMVQDYEGYFERYVRSLMARKQGKFKHRIIRVKAKPYMTCAVSYTINGEEIHLVFYSALRTGFGYIGEDDIEALINLL